MSARHDLAAALAVVRSASRTDRASAARFALAVLAGRVPLEPDDPDAGAQR